MLEVAWSVKFVPVSVTFDSGMEGKLDGAYANILWV